jgi:hypothetical protein
MAVGFEQRKPDLDKVVPIDEGRNPPLVFIDEKTPQGFVEF